MCVRLVNLSDESGDNLSDSLDVIDLEPKNLDRRELTKSEFEVSYPVPRP